MRRLRPEIKNVFKRLTLLIGALVGIILIALITDHFIYKNVLYPGISIAGIDLSGKTISEASHILEQKIKPLETLTIRGDDQVYSLNTKDINLTYDISASVGRAYNLTRSGNLFFDVRQKTDLLLNPINLGLFVKYDEANLDKYVSVLAGQDIKEPKYPSVKISGSKIVVDRGQPGREVDQNNLKILIGKNLAFLDASEINIPITSIDPSLTENEAENLRLRAEKFLKKEIVINFEDNKTIIKGNELIGFLDEKSGFNSNKISIKIEEISKKLERPPQNPKFQFEGGKVTEFLPAKDGIEIERDTLLKNVTVALNKLEDSDELIVDLHLPVKSTPPLVSTDKVNNLGIKELIGKGTSTYYHSIPGRVHNVALAATRINGTLVAPGETFSFNETLGDVSKFTGYKEAYIISEGKTILGDGGGVCQVSTTLFRALLNGGLPITERTAHAYRVGYYEQSSPPGLDATVYGPSPDLKFVNDTGNHILIQAMADTKNYSLVFELYGTKDGRTVTMTKPVVSNVSAPPPDRYQDDPSLPAGTTKQVEYKAWGAKVTFSYLVEKNGQQLFKKTFTSNYRPWQAVYLKGTGI